MGREIVPVRVTCQHLVERVTDYMEGALSDEERLRMEGHLAVCGGCRAYVAQMRATIQGARALRWGGMARAARPAAGPTAKDRLLAAFRMQRVEAGCAV